MKPRPRGRDGDCARGVESEKPDAGLAAGAHIRAHIQFRERGEPRNVRRSAKAHARHSKRDDSEPRASLEAIQFQTPRNQRPQRLRRNAPMHEKQVMPFLAHDPWPRRKRPRPMIGGGKSRRHCQSPGLAGLALGGLALAQRCCSSLGWPTGHGWRMVPPTRFVCRLLKIASFQCNRNNF